MALTHTGSSQGFDTTGDGSADTTNTVYEANNMTYGKGKSFQKWGTCYICGLDFRLDNMVKDNGRLYGIPCKCYKDVE